MALKHPETHNPDAQASSVSILGALGLAVALQIGARFFPVYSTWGFNYWAELPLAVGMGAIALFALTLIPAAAEGLYGAVATIAQGFRRLASSIPRIVRYVVGLPLLFGGILLLRSRVLVYGDGYIAVANTIQPLKHSFTGVHEYLKPLSVVMYRAGYVIFHNLFDASPELSFAIVSSLGGVVGFLAIARLAAAITPVPRQRIWLVCAALTSGCVMLFLGHIELYVWGAAFFLLFLGYSYRYLKIESGLLPILLSGILMTGFNAMLLPIALGISIYVVYVRHRGQVHAAFSPGKVVATLLLLALVGSIGLAAMLQYWLHHYGTVPFVATGDNPYTVLSLDHLLDMANIVMFAAPVGVCLLLAGLVRNRGRLSGHGILALATVIPFLVTFWIDSEIGAPRDWDLLSFFGFPLSLLGAVAVFPDDKQAPPSRGAIAALAAAGALILVPQVYVHLNATKGIERIDRLIWQDPHYQVTYEKAKRGIAWGALLQDNAQRVDLAEKYVRRRLTAEPKDDLAWFNLGQAAFRQKDYEKAAAMHGRAFAADPAVDKYRLAYAASLQALGRHDQVRSVIKGYNLVTMTDAEGVRTLAVILAQEAMYSEAAEAFRRVLALTAPVCTDYTNLGLAYFRAGNNDSAIMYFKLARQECPDEKQCDILQALLLAQLNLKDYGNALGTLEDYAKLCPSAADIEGLRRRISDKM